MPYPNEGMEGKKEAKKLVKRSHPARFVPFLLSLFPWFSLSLFVEPITCLSIPCKTSISRLPLWFEAQRMCAPLPYFQPFSHFAQVIPTIVHLSRSEINSEMDDPAGSGARFAGRGKWVKVECSLFSFPFHFPCSYESWTSIFSLEKSSVGRSPNSYTKWMKGLFYFVPRTTFATIDLHILFCSFSGFF